MVNISLSINFDLEEFEDYLEQAQDYFAKVTETQNIQKISFANIQSVLPSGIRYKRGSVNSPEKYKISEKGLLGIIASKRSLVKKIINNSKNIDSKKDVLEISDYSSIEDILKNLTGSEFIKLITNTPELNYIFDKSNKIEIITFLQDKQVNISTIIIDNKSLFNKYFTSDTLGKVIRIFTVPKIQDLINQILQKANNNFIKQNNTAIENDLKLLEAKKSNFVTLKGLYNVVLGYSIDTNTARSEGSFTDRIKPNRNRTVSSAQFASLLRRTIKADSPVGPLKGPPLSPTVLTYRTGRYANSIDASIDFEKNLVSFWYDPTYSIHEYISGAGFLRSPTRHIKKHVEQLTKELYGTRFRIIRKR